MDCGLWPVPLSDSTLRTPVQMMLGFALVGIIGGCGQQDPAPPPRQSEFPIATEQFKNLQLSYSSEPPAISERQFAPSAQLSVDVTFESRVLRGETAGVVNLVRVTGEQELIVQSAPFTVEKRTAGTWGGSFELKLPDSAGAYLLLGQLPIKDQLLFKESIEVVESK